MNLMIMAIGRNISWLIIDDFGLFQFQLIWEKKRAQTRTKIQMKILSQGPSFFVGSVNLFLSDICPIWLIIHHCFLLLHRFNGFYIDVQKHLLRACPVVYVFFGYIWERNPNNLLLEYYYCRKPLCMLQFNAKR